MSSTSQERTRKKNLFANQFGRRSRPRAKSEGTPLYYHIPGETGNTDTYLPDYDMIEKDEENSLTPLMDPVHSVRSYSLDSDPKYQLFLYGTSASWLTSGFSVSRLRSSKQNSIVTIFAIWNTIIGSSLLAIPWSVQKAGLLVAFALMIIVSTLAIYTAYTLLRVQLLHGNENVGEVPFLCKELLGRWAEIVARIFSFTIIFGANVVYWILMCNCLYHSVGFTVDKLFNVEIDPTGFNDTVLCPVIDHNVTWVQPQPQTLFGQIWTLETTVPIFLIFIVVPLLNFRSATFFTKFNSLGTLSVGYLLIFVLIKSSTWGINLNFVDTSAIDFVNLYEPTFFAMTGMLPLSLFIHNIVITLMRNNRHQQHNSRDLVIAYVLVVVTYILIGFTFYICFPLPKSCIEDNMLNNFPQSDGMTVLARIFLFFQLLTVFPLLSYMLRVQIFTALNYPSYPSAMGVAALNLLNVVGCVLFAIFLPRIGNIIRFTGAICGFVYVFTIPCVLHLYSEKLRGTLTVSSIIIHTLIPCIGLINLISQFFVSV